MGELLRAPGRFVRRVGAATVALAGARGGATAVEFALVSPVLIAMLMGVVSYGRLFLVCHVLQQAANDGARGGAVELTAAARRQTASARALSSLQALGAVDPARVTVSVDERGGAMIVGLTYDLSRDPLLNLPMTPEPTGGVAAHGVAVLGGL